MTLISADWSKDVKKRSVHVADVRKRCIRREEYSEWNLPNLLELARERAVDGSVLVGLDLVLGVPWNYWREVLKSGHWGHPTSFIDWIRRLNIDSEFFETVYTPSEWKVERPFFHVPKGKGGRKSFEARLDGGFLRKIDRCTGAKLMWAVSGIPGTVGSGDPCVVEGTDPVA